MAWIVAEAPPLIADIVAALADPTGATGRGLELPERERAEMLARLREGSDAAEQIPRDLAALQSLLVESIRREIPERRPGDFAAAVERLAELFGELQSAVTRSLVEERAGGAARDPLTGLPGPVELEEWIRVLLANHHRYGHGFALSVINLDGLGRINDAFGRGAGDRVVEALAGVIRRQVRQSDKAFRIEEDEFAILAPHQDASGLLPTAERIASLVAAAHDEEGPEIGVAAGIAACPANGETIEALLGSATEATYAAKAEGRPVAVSPNGSGMQDS